jgi:hypothetical protein
VKPACCHLGLLLLLYSWNMLLLLSLLPTPDLMHGCCDRA